MKPKANASKASLFPVYFVLFIDNFAFAVIFSIFGPLFVDPSFGFVTAEMSVATRNIMLGFALALFPLGQFFGCPFLGDIADRFGRKKAFYITIAISILGFLLSSYSIFTHSYFLLLFSRLLTGFFSGNLSICLAAIADLSPNEKVRAKNFSMIIIVTGISWMISILMGSLLSDPKLSSHFSPALPFLVTASLSCLSLIGIGVLFKETHPSQEKFQLNFLKGMQDIKNAFQIRELRSLYLVYLLWILGWGMGYQWLNPYSLQRFHVTSIDITWTQCVVGITWMTGGYFINSILIKRFQTCPTIIVATAITTLCLVGMALSPNFLCFSVFFLLGSITAAISWPNTLNLISVNAPKDIQGKIMGISQSAQAIGLISATLIGGIIGATSLKFMYPITALSLFCSWLILFTRHLRKKKASPKT